MAVSGTLRREISITATSTTGTAGSVLDRMNFGQTPISVPGATGVREWTKAASGSLVLLASTAQELDLSAIVAGIGTLNFATINHFEVWSENTTAAASITIAKGTSNGWEAPFSASGTLTFYAGGRVVIEKPLGAGYTVDGTHKTVKFTPSAHAHTMFYFIAGT